MTSQVRSLIALAGSTRSDPPAAGAMRQSTPRRPVERARIVELVCNGAVEPIARAIHARWVDEQIGAGKSAPPWEELDESRKESSRDQARDIPIKLGMLGYDIAPLRDRDARHFTFTHEEVERLAGAEHVRWMHERIADGWTAGDKDVTRKTTPYLVPFEELPAEIAEFDRMYVREIPRLLAGVGLQVVRTPTTTTTTERPV